MWNRCACEFELKVADILGRLDTQMNALAGAPGQAGPVPKLKDEILLPSFICRPRVRPTKKLGNPLVGRPVPLIQGSEGSKAGPSFVNGQTVRLLRRRQEIARGFSNTLTLSGRLDLDERQGKR
jgi:hypothetical protein